MRALHATGRTADALQCYADLRRQLVAELGIEPGAELQELHSFVLRGGEPPTARTVPAQLPRDVPGFCGREAELAELDGLRREAVYHPGAALVCGMPGVGKTSLAVHWAHRVAHQFPDGQLYANLRGFEPDGFALTPREAVQVFLDALGVPPARIPVMEQSQIGLYRSLIRDRRILIVLDNARDSGQVRDLLPAGRGCLALITSRNRLPDLVATEAVRVVPLDPLSTNECRPLLAHRLGSAQVEAEPQAVDDIIALCARLPLALSVVAAHVTIRPHGTLKEVAKELRSSDSLLDGFAATGTTIDPRTVFSWSWRGLSSQAARLFRLLSVASGPDLGRAAAASIAGVPLACSTTTCTRRTPSPG